MMAANREIAKKISMLDATTPPKCCGPPIHKAMPSKAKSDAAPEPSAFLALSLVRLRFMASHRTIQLTDGGHSLAFGLADGVAGPPLGAAPGSALVAPSTSLRLLAQR